MSAARRAECVALHPQWTIETWRDDGLDESRAMYIRDRGGVLIDSSMSCLRPFDPLLASSVPLLAPVRECVTKRCRRASDPYLGTAWMASPKGHEALVGLFNHSRRTERAKIMPFCAVYAFSVGEAHVCHRSANASTCARALPGAYATRFRDAGGSRAPAGTCTLRAQYKRSTDCQKNNADGCGSGRQVKQSRHRRTGSDSKVHHN